MLLSPKTSKKRPVSPKTNKIYCLCFTLPCFSFLFSPPPLPLPRAASKLEGKWEISLFLVAPPQVPAGRRIDSGLRRTATSRDTYAE